MLDLLSTTEVGRRVPAGEKNDVSAVFELEVQESLEERSTEAEEPGGRNHQCSFPRRTTGRPQERRRGR